MVKKIILDAAGQGTAFIIRKIPGELHKVFKSKCAAEGITMQDKMVELITVYVESEEGKE